MKFSPPFGVTYRGRDIFKCRTLRSGITVNDPALDYALASQWWGMNWAAFTAEEPDDKAFMVAVFRTQRQIDAVLAYEQHRRSNKKHRSSGGKRRT